MVTLPIIVLIALFAVTFSAPVLKFTESSIVQEAGLHGSTPTVTLDIKGIAGINGLGVPMLELSAGKSQVSAQLDTGSPGVYFVSPTTVYETKEGTLNVISCPRTYTPEDSKRSSTCRKKLVYGTQTVYGECYTDTVSFAGKSVTVEFTVATKIVSFSPPVCGIIGAGMDSAFMHGLVQGLDANRFSIGMKFELLSDPDQGKLWIGDDGNTQAYTGELITFPILPDDRIMISGANKNGDALAKKSMHWQFSYDVEMDGDRLENEQGFFDSGASTVIFSRNILATLKSYWQKHAPSTEPFPTRGHGYRCDLAQYWMPEITIKSGQSVLTIPVSAYMIPVVAANPNSCYFWFDEAPASFPDNLSLFGSPLHHAFYVSYKFGPSLGACSAGAQQLSDCGSISFARLNQGAL